MSLATSVHVLASSSCIGTGCPGTTGTSHTGAYIIGAVLVVAGAALLVLGQRRDRKERTLATSEVRAASVVVTLMRAFGVLAVIIGALTLILRP